LLMLVCVGIVANRNSSQLHETSQRVTHTYAVLGRVSGVRSLLASYEATGRGYALSGDESYLDSEATTKAQIVQTMNALRTLTEDNPVQQRRLDTLEPIVMNRIDIRDAMVRARREQGI